MSMTTVANPRTLGPPRKPQPHHPRTTTNQTMANNPYPLTPAPPYERRRSGRRPPASRDCLATKGNASAGRPRRSLRRFTPPPANARVQRKGRVNRQGEYRDLGGGRSGRVLSGKTLAPPGQGSVRRWRSSSPTSRRARPGRATTASALAAAPASLCLCHASSRPAGRCGLPDRPG
jgi:hypothetical protein